MTLEEVRELREIWRNDAGTAAKHVLLLCDTVERLYELLWPCKGGCTRMATHAVNDVIFGVGLPELCFECAKKDDRRDWIERMPR